MNSRVTSPNKLGSRKSSSGFLMWFRISYILNTRSMVRFDTSQGILVEVTEQSQTNEVPLQDFVVRTSSLITNLCRSLPVLVDVFRLEPFMTHFLWFWFFMSTKFGVIFKRRSGSSTSVSVRYTSRFYEILYTREDKSIVTSK